MRLYHFMCQKCKTEFWLNHMPREILCPNLNCHNLWAPSRAVEVLARGIVMDFQPLSVRPNVQSHQD